MIFCDKCGKENYGTLGKTKCVSCGNIIGSQVITTVQPSANQYRPQPVIHVSRRQRQDDEDFGDDGYNDAFSSDDEDFDRSRLNRHSRPHAEASTGKTFTWSQLTKRQN